MTTPDDQSPTTARRWPGTVDDLERLVSGLGGFICTLAKRIRQLAMLLAGVAGAFGVVGLVLGLWAWHDSRGGLIFVLLICIPAVLVPLFAYRRLAPITEAVAHPDETARQARSYFSGIHGSPELSQLVQEAAGLHRAGGSMRLKGAFRSARLLGSVVSSVEPDPRTQPLVAAFHPARIRSIWLAVIASWWLAFLSSLVAVVAAFSIVVDSIA